MRGFIDRLLAASAKTKVGRIQTALRLLLGAALAYAGLSHLWWSRSEFLAQVPDWFPVDADLVVLASGVVEILIGVALLVAAKYRVIVGIIAAAFFIAIFPGNIAQLVEGTDAFGLNSDTSRAVRLLFQPVLVMWALWSTGAWGALRTSASSD
ncbi:MAG: DoxX family protein [Acidimicrobiales bacterium]